MYPQLDWAASACYSLYGVDKTVSAISLALVSGEGVILFGPPGNGKTKMIDEILKTLARVTEDPLKTWSATLTSASTVDDLVGPLDIGPIVEAKGGPYNHRRTEEGLLHSDVVWLREGLSAPPPTLAALRDIMESKIFANGDQQVPSSVRAWLMDTNIEPSELSAMGEEYRALTERFPIQVHVNQSPTTANLVRSYHRSRTAPPATPVKGFSKTTMIRAQEKLEDIDVPASILEGSAQLMTTAAKNGGFVVNPRLHQKGVRLMRASAMIHGRGHVTSDDYAALIFVPGGDVLEPDMADRVRSAAVHSRARSLLDTGHLLVNEIVEMWTTAKAGFISKQQVNVCLDELHLEVQKFTKIPDVMVADRDELLERIRSLRVEYASGVRDLLQMTPAQKVFLGRIHQLRR
jgi:MoxR-like ATPase